MVIVALALAAGIGGLALLLLRDGDASELAIPSVTSERLQLALGATTQPFAPDRACDVYVVPVDGWSEGSAARLARALPLRVPVRACTTSSFRLDLSALDSGREQLDAVVVSDQLARAFQDAKGITPATILGVTAFDIYSSAFAGDPFDFGVAKKFPQKQGFAVVSTARMGSGEELFERLETMAMRYLGLLHFGLSESASPGSALNPSLRSLEDLDLLEPRFSDPQPSSAVLKAARKEFLAQE